MSKSFFASGDPQLLGESPRNYLRIGFFGDSIAAGLGARGNAYPSLVARGLGASLHDYSHSGWTIAESLASYVQKHQTLDVAVIAHGITEPIIRPILSGVRFIPNRWRRLGWMDPRPYYSNSPLRRTMEKLESELRWRVKNNLIRLKGSYQLLDMEAYVDGMSRLTKLLQNGGCEVYVLQPTAIDEKYFPGSASQQLDYFEALEKELKGVSFISPGLDLDKHFLADRFHPSEAGHFKIAERIQWHLKRL